MAEDRWAVSTSRYNWGAAKYFYFIVIAITLVSVIWLLITKIKTKKTIVTAEEGDLK